MKEKNEGKRADLKRREFLRGSAAAGVGVAAAALLPGEASAGAAEPEGSASESRGYRLTEHVMAYYKSAAS